MGMDMSDKLQERFVLLMEAAKLRLGANNFEMWENHSAPSPWSVLDRLAAIPGDREAAEWLLMGSRAQEILCVVMGYEKILYGLDKGDEKAERFAQAAGGADGLGEAFSIFAMYWFNIPIGYWRTLNTGGSEAYRAAAAG